MLNNNDCEEWKSKLVEKLNSANHKKLRRSTSKIQMSHIGGCQINLLKMQLRTPFSTIKEKQTITLHPS